MDRCEGFRLSLTSAGSGTSYKEWEDVKLSDYRVTLDKWINMYVPQYTKL